MGVGIWALQMCLILKAFLKTWDVPKNWCLSLCLSQWGCKGWKTKQCLQSVSRDFAPLGTFWWWKKIKLLKTTPPWHHHSTSSSSCVSTMKLCCCCYCRKFHMHIEPKHLMYVTWVVLHPFIHFLPLYPVRGRGGPGAYPSVIGQGRDWKFKQ